MLIYLPRSQVMNSIHLTVREIAVISSVRGRNYIDIRTSPPVYAEKMNGKRLTDCERIANYAQGEVKYN